MSTPKRYSPQIEELLRRTRADFAPGLPYGFVESEFRKLPSLVRDESKMLFMPTHYKAGKLYSPRQIRPKNLLPYSHRFDNATWTKSNITISPNVIANPVDGVINGQLTVETTSADVAHQFVQSTAVLPEKTYTYSIYAKSNGRGYLLSFAGRSLYWALNANVAPTTASHVTWASNGVSSVTYSVTHIQDGWYRLVFAFTLSRAGAYSFQNMPAPGLSSSWVGDAATAGGTYFYGAQLERGPVATAYEANPSGENLLAYSQKYISSPWAATGIVAASIMAGDIAPDGTPTAFRANLLSASTTHGYNQNITKVSSTAIKYTLSCYAKVYGTGSRWVTLRIGGTSSTNNIIVYVDIVDNVIGSNALTGSGVTYHNATVENDVDGWKRISLTCTTDTTTNIVPIFGVAQSDGVSVFAGNAGDYTTLFWGHQLNYGAYVLPYFKTTYLNTEARTLDYDWTFTRAGNATYVGSDGLIQYAPANQLLQSENFATSWSLTNTTVAANTITAPDGTLTADTLANTAVSNTHYVRQSISSPAVGQWFTFSVYAKAGTITEVGLYQEVSDVGTIFDLSTATYSNYGSGSGTVFSAGMVHVGDGWYRCWTTINIISQTVPSYRIQLIKSGATSYLGATTDTLHLWGAQVNMGRRLLPYVQTTTAALYGPRFEYDENRNYKGILSEKTSTNLFLYSEDFSNAAWAKTAATITTDNRVSPDGFQTADLIDLTNSTHEVSQTVAVTASAFYSTSFWVYRGTATDLKWAAYDMSNGGAVISAPTSYYASTSASGWVRVTLPEIVTPTGCTSLKVCLIKDSGVTGTAWIWGAQVENDRGDTSYMPTLAAAAARAAETISISTATQPDWFDEGEKEGSYYFHGDIDRPRWLTTGRLLTRGSANTGHLLIDPTSSGTLGVSLVINDGTNQDSLGGTTIRDTLFKVANGYSNSAKRAALDGVLKTASNFTGQWVGTTLQVGGQGGVMVGHVRSVAFFLRRLTDTELQEITSFQSI